MKLEEIYFNQCIEVCKNLSAIGIKQLAFFVLYREGKYADILKKALNFIYDMRYKHT